MGPMKFKVPGSVKAKGATGSGSRCPPAESSFRSGSESVGGDPEGVNMDLNAASALATRLTQENQDKTDRPRGTRLSRLTS